MNNEPITLTGQITVPETLTGTIEIQNTVLTGDIDLGSQLLEGEVKIGAEETRNYDYLYHKPKINGKELVGDVTLLDLGIDPLTEEDVIELFKDL